MSFASISDDDQNILIEHLGIMNENGYVQSSVSACQPIMGDSGYDWQDWDEFYWDYFHSIPPTSNLFQYIGYPMYYWFGDDIHYNHQKGMMRTLLDILTTVIGNQSGNNLGELFQDDINLRNSFFVCFSQLSGFVNSDNSVLDENSKQEILSELMQWVDNNQEYLLKSMDLNAFDYPYQGLIRRQAIMFLIDIEPLTDERAEYLAQYLDFTGLYRDILTEHKLYIADNNGMSQSDLEYINNIMTFLPDTLTNLRYLSNNGYFYYGTQSDDGVVIAGYSGGVNTFSTVGGYVENGYPSDISPLYIDGFSVVVAHELNHRVDPDYIYINEELNARRFQLLDQAGLVDLNYLRSNVGGEFFQNAPQEFIASIANLWFCSTEHTLNLALQRFENGYIEPLNQFLYFTELYATNSNNTQFYTVDTDANISMQSVPVFRNSDAFINQFEYDNLNYYFELDSFGNVLNYYYSQMGDLNSDNIINILDIVLMVNIILAGNEFIDAADINNDGLINIIDILQLVNIIIT